jgi:hypothetical protein
LKKADRLRFCGIEKFERIEKSCFAKRKVKEDVLKWVFGLRGYGNFL